MRFFVARTNRGKQQVRRLHPPRETPCGYCFSRWATAYDHLLPWSLGGTESQDNLYPTCGRCNSIAGALVFSSIEEKRAYVQQRLVEKRERESSVPRVSYYVFPEEAPKILRRKVSMERVAPKKVSKPPKERRKRAPVKRFYSSNRKCLSCGNDFMAKREDHRFCGMECRITKMRAVPSFKTLAVSWRRKRNPLRYIMCEESAK